MYHSDEELLQTLKTHKLFKRFAEIMSHNHFLSGTLAYPSSMQSNRFAGLTHITDTDEIWIGCRSVWRRKKVWAMATVYSHLDRKTLIVTKDPETVIRKFLEVKPCADTFREFMLQAIADSL